MESRGPKLNSSKLLCLSWLPAALMMIRSKMNELAWRHHFPIISLWEMFQDQDQDSLLVKRRNDNHSPGPVIRELVPSSHQRSELSNTILCIFSE